MYKHILLPTDGSELSGRATKAGLQLAKAIGAKVTGFHAAPRFPHSINAAPDVHTTTPARLEQSANPKAEMYLSAIAAMAKAMGVPCDSAYSISDSPADAIVQAAVDRGCDLIFMAPHGDTGSLGGMLGSNTRDVLMKAQASVTVHR